MGIKMRKMPFLRLFISAIISFSLTFEFPISAYGDDKPCILKSFEDSLGNTRLKIYDASNIKKSAYLNVTDLFGNSQEALLGIGQSGHSYLVVGNVRYDGEIFAGFGTVRTNSTLISPGTVIRFKDLAPETIDALKNQLMQGKGKLLWSSNCYSGACNQLKASGIRLAGGQPLLPSSFFKRMFTKGFVDSTGKPISIEIYRTDNTSLDQLYRHLQNVQRKVLSSSSYKIGIVVSASSILIVACLTREPKK